MSSTNTTTYSISSGTDNWYKANDTSGNSTTIVGSTDWVQRTTQTPSQPSGACNESKVHNHAEKAVFHGMKSALRFSSTGMKGVPERQVYEGMRIAAEVGKAFLQSEDYDYDPEKSQEYLESNFLDKFRSEEKIIEKAIDKAWKKIDNGNHKGGARIAVSLGQKYLHDFRLPE